MIDFLSDWEQLKLAEKRVSELLEKANSIDISNPFVENNHQRVLLKSLYLQEAIKANHSVWQIKQRMQLTNQREEG